LDPLLQGGSVLVDQDFLGAIHPLYFASLLGSFYFGLRSLTASTGISPDRSGALLSSAATLLLASTYFLVWQSVYIHNSLPSAVYLLLFLICTWSASRSGNTRTLSIGFISLAGFTLCRTEAPVFASLAIFVSASLLEGEPIKEQFRALSVWFLLFAISWYTFLVSAIGTGSDILTASKAIIQLSVLASVVALVVLEPKYRLVSAVFLRAPSILLAEAIFLTVAALLYAHEHVMINESLLFLNVTVSGR